MVNEAVAASFKRSAGGGVVVSIPPTAKMAAKMHSAAATKPLGETALAKAGWGRRRPATVLVLPLLLEWLLLQLWKLHLKLLAKLLLLWQM